MAKARPKLPEVEFTLPLYEGGEGGPSGTAAAPESPMWNTLASRVRTNGRTTSILTVTDRDARGGRRVWLGWDVGGKRWVWQERLDYSDLVVRRMTWAEDRGIELVLPDVKYEQIAVGRGRGGSLGRLREVSLGAAALDEDVDDAIEAAREALAVAYRRLSDPKARAVALKEVAAADVDGAVEALQDAGQALMDADVLFRETRRGVSDSERNRHRALLGDVRKLAAMFVRGSTVVEDGKERAATAEDVLPDGLPEDTDIGPPFGAVDTRLRLNDAAALAADAFIEAADAIVAAAQAIQERAFQFQSLDKGVPLRPGDDLLNLLETMGAVGLVPEGPPPSAAPTTEPVARLPDGSIDADSFTVDDYSDPAYDAETQSTLADPENFLDFPGGGDDDWEDGSGAGDDRSAMGGAAGAARSAMGATATGALSVKVVGTMPAGYETIWGGEVEARNRTAAGALARRMALADPSIQTRLKKGPVEGKIVAVRITGKAGMKGRWTVDLAVKTKETLEAEAKVKKEAKEALEAVWAKVKSIFTRKVDKATADIGSTPTPTYRRLLAEYRTYVARRLDHYRRQGRSRVDAERLAFDDWRQWSGAVPEPQRRRRR